MQAIAKRGFRRFKSKSKNCKNSKQKNMQFKTKLYSRLYNITSKWMS